MSHRTQLNRADVLDCLRAYGTDQLDTFVDALGYTRRDPSPSPHAQVVRPPPVSFTMPESTQLAPPVSTPKARFYRVVAQRHLDPDEVQRSEPAWYRNAEVLHANDPALRANPQAPPPPPAPPLMPWSRLWPFLKAALGAQQFTSALDIPPIVERLARRQPLTDVPHKQRPGWAPACQVLVDFAMSLFPFWSDFETLCRRLRPLRSTQGLAVLGLPDGEPEGRCWSQTPQGWSETDRYRTPPAGTPVLVLSDLGCLDTSETRRRQWRSLGQRLRRAGCRPIALMPCPARWWDTALTCLFVPVCWDRTVRPPQRLITPQIAPGTSARTASGYDAGAELLLTLLAPAIRVEPALLRAVRSLLAAHEADVGSEAAAWNHPQVQANALAFAYGREALITYRERFKHCKDASLRQQIAAVIAVHHAHLSPVIAEEEGRIAAELLGESIPEEGLLPRLVKTLRTQEGDLARMVDAWVQRMAPRQHPALWRDEILQALVVAGQVGQKEALALPPEVELHRVSWVLAPQREPQDYTLRQRGRALYLELDAPDQSATAYDAPGSPLATVRAAAPVVQWQHTADAVQRHAIAQAVPLPASGLLHLSTDYQELTIDSIERPAWADAIGRDAYGLFVEFSVAGVKQRLRWIVPGEFLMGSPQDEPERYERETQHLVRLSRGFWLADTACTQALWRSCAAIPAVLKAQIGQWSK